MTTKKLRLLSLITFSSICSLAHADPYTGTVTTADHGFILSAEGGYAWLLGTPNATMDGSTGTYKRGDITWGANLGYAWPLDTMSAVSLELGYADNGQNKYTGGGGALNTGTLTIKSQDIQALGGFNSIWDSGINAFLKLGATVLQQKADLTATALIDGTHVAKFSSTKYYPRPMAVIGMGYKITPSVNLYIEGSGIYGELNSNWSSVGTTPNKINAGSFVFAGKVGLSYAFSE